MDFKGTIFNYKKLTEKDLQELMESLIRNRPSTYNPPKIIVDELSAKLINLNVKQIYSPSEENEREIQAIHDTINKQCKESQVIHEERFIKEYSQDLLEFIKTLYPKDKNFLLGSFSNFYLSWEVKYDSENEDYYKVTFFKGKFSYVLDSCGGYAGSEILEEDISRERVLELLNIENGKR